MKRLEKHARRWRSGALFAVHAQDDSLQAGTPDVAGHAWAAIDRKVVDAAAIIPYGQGVQRYVVNPRVGHTIIHPITGPLLAQMWVE